MEFRGITRDWLETLDPAEFLAISSMISDIQRERAEARQRKLEERRASARGDGRYLRLERVKCGKKGCRRCKEGELHGPYWYLYRPKKTGPGRTSEYVGKTLPVELADEFGVSHDQRTTG